MKGWLLAAAIVVVGLAVYLLWPTTPTYTNYPSNGTDIVAIGDSLVYGTGSGKDGDFVTVVSKQVGQPIVNLGVPGNTSADVLARMSELDAYKPKVVILLVGGNDYLRRVNKDETFNNIRAIVAQIQSRGAVVLLLGIRGGVLGDPYAPEFKAIAKEYKTAFVSDVLKGILDHPELKFDEVHPNDEGYAVIANRVAPVLKQLLN